MVADYSRLGYPREGERIRRNSFINLFSSRCSSSFLSFVTVTDEA